MHIVATIGVYWCFLGRGQVVASLQQPLVDSIRRPVLAEEVGLLRRLDRLVCAGEVLLLTIEAFDGVAGYRVLVLLPVKFIEQAAARVQPHIVVRVLVAEALDRTLAFIAAASIELCTAHPRDLVQILHGDELAPYLHHIMVPRLDFFRRSGGHGAFHWLAHRAEIDTCMLSQVFFDAGVAQLLHWTYQLLLLWRQVSLDDRYFRLLQSFAHRTRLRDLQFFSLDRLYRDDYAGNIILAAAALTLERLCR